MEIGSEETEPRTTWDSGNPDRTVSSCAGTCGPPVVSLSSAITTGLTSLVMVSCYLGDGSSTFCRNNATLYNNVSETGFLQGASRIPKDENA